MCVFVCVRKREKDRNNERKRRKKKKERKREREKERERWTWEVNILNCKFLRMYSTSAASWSVCFRRRRRGLMYIIIRERGSEQARVRTR